MNDNLAIGIMTSINLKERYMACESTWTKNFDNVFFFGGNQKDEKLITLESVGEDYSSAFLKQQLGLKYMFECDNNFDWFSMNGCDHILFKKNVQAELLKYDKNVDIFLGQTNGYMNVNETKMMTVAGGGSYFISNSLMKKIYPKILEFNNLWYNLSKSHLLPVPYGTADIAITYMIKLYFNIDVIHVAGMFSQHPNSYNDQNNYLDIKLEDKERLNSPLSFHYIKPNEMQIIYDRYK